MAAVKNYMMLMVPGITIISLCQKRELRFRKAEPWTPEGMMAASCYTCQELSIIWGIQEVINKGSVCKSLCMTRDPQLQLFVLQSWEREGWDPNPDLASSRA